MQGSGGFVTVPTPGTPVNAASNVQGYATKGVPCHGYLFQGKVGNVGKVYIGLRGFNKTTGVGLFHVLLPPTDIASPPPSFSVALTIAPNGLNLAEVFIDADQANDGVLITYLQT